MHTPWGPAQTQTTIAPGILSITTASHGGIWVSQERLAAMPAEYQATKYPGPSYDSQGQPSGAWFEEDSAWVGPVLAFWPEFAACYQRKLDDYRRLQPAKKRQPGIDCESYDYAGRILYADERDWCIEHYQEKLSSERQRAQDLYDAWYAPRQEKIQWPNTGQTSTSPSPA